MYKTHILENEKVLDVAYNHYGTRMATSCGINVQVWDKNKYGKWQLSNSWEFGDSLVWKLLWVHKIYGEILIICSVNNIISIWQEYMPFAGRYSENEHLKIKHSYFQNSQSNEEKYSRQWVDSKHGDEDSYNKSVIFGDMPKHFTNSKLLMEDGEPNIKKQKVNEPFEEELASVLKTLHLNGYKVNGSKLKFDSAFNEEGKLITEYCQSLTKWTRRAQITIPTKITDIKFASYNLGLILAVCCSDGAIKLYGCMDTTCLENWYLKHEISSEFSWSCLSWTDTVSDNLIPLLAAGCTKTENQLQKPITRTSNAFLTGNNETSMNSQFETYGGSNYELQVRIFEFHKVDEILCPTSVTIEVYDPVHCLKFAPTLSNASYYILAVASSNIAIFKIEPEWDTLHSVISYDVTNLTKLDPKVERIWNLDWNIVGDMLVSSANNGHVHLWKNISNYWNCFCTIKSNSDDDAKMKSEKVVTQKMPNIFSKPSTAAMPFRKLPI